MIKDNEKLLTKFLMWFSISVFFIYLIFVGYAIKIKSSEKTLYVQVISISDNENRDVSVLKNVENVYKIKDIEKEYPNSKIKYSEITNIYTVKYNEKTNTNEFKLVGKVEYFYYVGNDTFLLKVSDLKNYSALGKEVIKNEQLGR